MPSPRTANLTTYPQATVERRYPPPSRRQPGARDLFEYVRSCTCPVHHRRSSDFIGPAEDESGKKLWKFRCTGESKAKRRAAAIVQGNNLFSGPQNHYIHHFDALPAKEPARW